MSKMGPPPIRKNIPSIGSLATNLNKRAAPLFAAKTQLLRRLHLSLTGLPPTLEQLLDFEHAPPVERLNQTLDQLLESPTTANGGLDTGWTWRTIRGLEWA